MMRRWMLVLGALAVAACGTDSSGSDTPRMTAASDSMQWGPLNDTLFRRHAAKVEAALGTFEDITVFERPDSAQPWQLVSGAYTPVTVDGEVPASYASHMRSDRPMMLPTDVEGFDESDGQSNPYNVAGRMEGSNPEVQWVFVVRQYTIKDPSDDDFAHSPDIAVIGHHPRTGATSFFQYYSPHDPRPAEVVISPFSEGAPDFWSPIVMIADSFSCQRCHDAGPFIHTPWVDQVRAWDVAPGGPPAPPVVPSDPLGPYFFVDAEDDQGLFWRWNSALRHYDDPENGCTQCHRIGNDLIGLNQNSTKYFGLSEAERNSWAVQSDSSQTAAYEEVRWMPPVNTPSPDFYAGHDIIQNPQVGVWEMNYGPSAAAVNRVTRSDSTWREAEERGEVVPVPRPPTQYSSILVDRPNQDVIGAGRTVWIVDTRMRANTDGDLESWQFVAGSDADPDVQVAPVVYRRVGGDGSRAEFEVSFVGAPRAAVDAGDWVSVAGGSPTFPVEIGSYFGLVVTNTGTEPAPAPIPYTEDDWAELQWRDGSTRYLNGYGHWQGLVTMQFDTTGTAPEAGTSVTFSDAAYRTYSFELRNRIGG